LIPSIIFYKNVQLYMTEDHQKHLASLLEEPSNEWLKVSLQPIVETDNNGLITMFRPMKKVSMSIVFFFQNLMIEQRLFLMDDFLRKNGVIK